MTRIGPAMAPDFTIEQNWERYSAEEHAIWRLLFERQQKLLVGRACREYLDGLDALGVAARRHPRFPAAQRRSSTAPPVGASSRCRGWSRTRCFLPISRARRFPSTCFIRRRDQLDYLQEPDVFHDICGHVPLLMNPVFADYMQAYGAWWAQGGGSRPSRAAGAALLVHGRVRADRDAGGFAHLRLGHFVVGSGESVYCLDDPRPQRLGFDLRRVMRTRYHIDRYQDTYFVIDDFEQLFEATRPDFRPGLP